MFFSPLPDSPPPLTAPDLPPGDEDAAARAGLQDCTRAGSCLSDCGPPVSCLPSPFLSFLHEIHINPIVQQVPLSLFEVSARPDRLPDISRLTASPDIAGIFESQVRLWKHTFGAIGAAVAAAVVMVSMSGVHARCCCPAHLVLCGSRVYVTPSFCLLSTLRSATPPSQVTPLFRATEMLGCCCRGLPVSPTHSLWLSRCCWETPLCCVNSAAAFPSFCPSSLSVAVGGGGVLSDHTRSPVGLHCPLPSSLSAPFTLPFPLLPPLSALPLPPFFYLSWRAQFAPRRVKNLYRQCSDCKTSNMSRRPTPFTCRSAQHLLDYSTSVLPLPPPLFLLLYRVFLPSAFQPSFLFALHFPFSLPPSSPSLPWPSDPPRQTGPYTQL